MNLASLHAEAMDLRDLLVPLADRLMSPSVTTVDPAEHMRLQRQCAAMRDYLTVLTERIEAFTGQTCN